MVQTLDKFIAVLDFLSLVANAKEVSLVVDRNRDLSHVFTMKKKKWLSTQQL